MPFDEYKKVVYNKCKQDEIVKRFPDEFEKVFAEEIELLYKKNVSIESAVYYICLMV